MVLAVTQDIVSVDTVCLILLFFYAVNRYTNLARFIPLPWRLDVPAGNGGDQEETLTGSRSSALAESALPATSHAWRTFANPSEVAPRGVPLGPVIRPVSTYPSLLGEDLGDTSQGFHLDTVVPEASLQALVRVAASLKKEKTPPGGGRFVLRWRLSMTCVSKGFVWLRTGVGIRDLRTGVPTRQKNVKWS